MPVRIEREPEEIGIPICDMLEGQLAEILRFPHFPVDVGKIAQRCDDDLIFIGVEWAESHAGLFVEDRTDIRVRILPPGTRLVVE